MKKVIRKILNGVKIFSAVIVFCLGCGAVEDMNIPLMIVTWSYFYFFMFINISPYEYQS